VGLSVVEQCRNPLGTAIARDEFEGEFYANGAVLSRLVEMKGRSSSDDALKRFKDTFKALYTGRGKRHGVPGPGGWRDAEAGRVADEGPRVRRGAEHDADGDRGHVQPAAEQARRLERRRADVRDGRDEPDRYRDRRDRADGEHDREAVSQDPSILPQNVMSAEFVLEAMMRADAKSRAKFYKIMSGVGAITPDEIRKRENMPALTEAQKRELKPPAPAPPAPGGLGLVAGADAPVVNGNGNGAMPATT
jgi:hypothetical protein